MTKRKYMCLQDTTIFFASRLMKNASITPAIDPDGVVNDNPMGIQYTSKQQA